MAKPKFLTQIWFARDIPNVKGDPKFVKFIFQVKNSDTDNKNDFDLMVYGRNDSGHDYPPGLNHDSLVSVSGHHLPRRRLNVANLIMTKAQLAAVWPNGMHHLRFWAVDDPNHTNYVTYWVRPEDEDNNPRTFLTDPHEIYDKDMQFNFGDQWGVYQDKIEMDGQTRLFLMARLNPSPPAVS